MNKNRVIDKFLAFTSLRNTKFYLNLVKIYAENYNLKYLKYLAFKNKNKIKSFVIKLFYLKEFLSLFFFNLLIKKSSNKSKRDKDIKKIVFVLNKKDGWVLEGIAKDLKRVFLEKYPNLKINITSLRDLKKYVDEETKLLFMHQNLLRKIFNFNIDLRNIYCYYTHTRTLNQRDVFLYSSINCLFSQSRKEINLLSVNGVEISKLSYLPIGYDKKQFPKVDLSLEREYDFCFSVPYFEKYQNPHYFNRKEIKLIEYLACKFSFEGFKVLLIGKGWNESSSISSSKCKYMNIKYEEKSEFLSKVKIFLNLSSYEGGPVTVLEAASSGCNIISRDVGITFDLSCDISNCYLINDSDNYAEWYKRILEIKENLKLITQTEYENNLNILETKYEFNALAKVIYERMYLK